MRGVVPNVYLDNRDVLEALRFAPHLAEATGAREHFDGEPAFPGSGSGGKEPVRMELRQPRIFSPHFCCCEVMRDVTLATRPPYR